MRVAAYVRVSTQDQNCALQIRELTEYVQRRGWELAGIYQDQLSGAKANRPGLGKLMADARRREFDVVCVWRFDRFARSAKQLVLALEEFRALGIEFISHQEALDTSTPMGKAMFTIIAAMAELERNVIRERVMAGLRVAKSKGRNPASRSAGRGGSLTGRRPQNFGARDSATALSPAGWASARAPSGQQALAGLEGGSGCAKTLLRRHLVRVLNILHLPTRISPATTISFLLVRLLSLGCTLPDKSIGVCAVKRLALDPSDHLRPRVSDRPAELPMGWPFAGEPSFAERACADADEPAYTCLIQPFSRWRRGILRHRSSAQERVLAFDGFAQSVDFLPQSLKGLFKHVFNRIPTAC